jgi:hypothetical protein
MLFTLAGLRSRGGNGASAVKARQGEHCTARGDRLIFAAKAHLFYKGLFLMVRFFYALSAVFLMAVALTSCEDVTTFDYLTSPDQMYVLEIEKHPGAAMVSSTMWVRIKKRVITLPTILKLSLKVVQAFTKKYIGETLT